MGLLDDFKEAEAFHFMDSQERLESFHEGSIATMEAAGELFQSLAAEFGDQCALPEAEANVNAWLKSVDGPSHQLVEFLGQAELVG